MSNPKNKTLLDSTIKSIGETFGSVSGTKGKAGIAFIIASGDDADRLSEYIEKVWSKRKEQEK